VEGLPRAQEGKLSTTEPRTRKINRLNAIIPEGVGFDEEEQRNLEGTLTLHHTRVKTLFDTGATNSFIAIEIMYTLGLVSQPLEKPLCVVSPLGATFKLSRVCRDFPLNVGNCQLTADLIPLSMKEFDLILGFDWLTKHQAKLDCTSRTITITPPTGLPFLFNVTLLATPLLQLVWPSLRVSILSVNFQPSPLSKNMRTYSETLLVYHPKERSISVST